MRNPKRIRSKNIFFIYPEVNDREYLINHLSTNLGITDDKKWSFVAKTELTQTGTNTLVFVESLNCVDIYVQKFTLNLDNKQVIPQIYCSSVRDLYLRYILTFYGSFNYHTDIHTNYPIDYLSDKVTILKIVEHMSTQRAIEQKPKIQKRKIGNKQVEKFNTFFLKFNQIYELGFDHENIEKLEKYLRNIKNYRSNYDLPEEFLDKIQECSSKVIEFKKYRFLK